MDVLRLLCWCQNVRPDDLSSISTETERENLITLGLIKRHQRSDTLLLTNSGRAFLQAALEGDVPNLTLSYHDAAIERRVRLSSLMMTAYHAGINVFTITANSLAEPSTLFITAITRSRGHNPWGSARVGAIAHLGSTYYAVHYIYSGIGRMAVNDELAAFHNHTNFGKDTQRAFLFAGASYADIMEELKARDEKRDAKLIRYSEAYWKHWTLCWSLQGCSPDFTRKTDCMNHFSCALPETERGPDTFSAWHGWTPLLTLQPSPV